MPRCLRQRFLEMVHAQATGHFAYKNTLGQVQKRAFWDSWKMDVKLYCACCNACNEFYRGHVPKQAGLKPLFAGAPMEVLARRFDGTARILSIYLSIYLSFGQGSSLLWTNTLRPFIAGPLR